MLLFRRTPKIQFMKKLNPPWLLLLISAIIFACLILYRSFNSAPGNAQSFLRNNQSNLDNPRLIELLRKVTMSDRIVILTVLDEAWARPGSVLELFLESFQVGNGTKRFLNHLLIVTTDDQAYQHCKALHLHCFPLRTRKDGPAGKFDRRIIGLLRQINDLGYNLLFTDADVMWLKNPFLHVDPLAELTIGCKVYTGDSNRADTGFFFANSNDVTVEFLKYWEVAMVLYPGKDAQSVLEMIMEDEVVQFTIRPRIKYLDTAYFSGFRRPNMDMKEVHTMHANCCEDLESKLHDLRLVLDQWRSSSIPGFFSWSFPRKCRK